MTQFKDKSAREQELVRTSLFLYPVLQAADILLYKTDQVPVGEDQRQHLELAREIARRFNSTYGEVFVEPEAVIPTIGRADHGPPGARHEDVHDRRHARPGSMYIDDEPEAIVKKIKRAQTDSGSDVVRGPDKAGITNLIDIYSVARGRVAGPGGARVRGSGLRCVQAVGGRGGGRAPGASARALRRAARGRGRPRAHPACGCGARARDRRAHHGGGAFRHGTGPAARSNKIPSGARAKESIL